MNKVFFCICILYFSLNSFGSLDLLDSENDFIQRTTVWKTECDNATRFIDTDPNFLINLELFFKKSVFEGLQRLNKINPALAEKALLDTIDRPLLIKCLDNDGGHSQTFNKIFFGNTSEIYIGLVPYSVANNNRQNRRPVILDDFYKLPDEHLSRHIIFHEFLHFAELDNLSTREHNKKSTERKDDVIYGCTHAVFSVTPNQYPDLNESDFMDSNDEVIPYGKYYSICAKAKLLEKNGTMIDEQ
jgi:hypothetical protein